MNTIVKLTMATAGVAAVVLMRRRVAQFAQLTRPDNPPRPDLSAIVSECQAAYADGMDLVEAYADAQDTGILDIAQIRVLQHRINCANPRGARMLASFQAGLLAGSAVQLGRLTGTDTSEVLAQWRQLSAAALNLAEQRWAKEFGAAAAPEGGERS